MCRRRDLALVFRLARQNPGSATSRPLLLMLIAFHEMDWSTPADAAIITWSKPGSSWDRMLLDHHGLRAISKARACCFPCFSSCATYWCTRSRFVALWALLAHGRRDRLNKFWLIYLAGTLGAYALFPYFPSEPPRIVPLPAPDLPSIVTVLRRFNLWIVGHYGIHSSVFPSAHVSSTFSAAWGLLETLPGQRWIGWTWPLTEFVLRSRRVYGRYHYAVDVATGIAVSFLGLAAMKIARYRKSLGA